MPVSLIGKVIAMVKEIREALIAASGRGCALSDLLGAAAVGRSPVSSPTRASASVSTTAPNGIPLSKIHHAAFDAHLIGIDPDY